MGAFAQVAFAVYVLYSQEGRRAALAHWGLAECGTPAVGSLSVLLPPLHTPLVPPSLLCFSFTSFSCSSFLKIVLLRLSFFLYLQLLPLPPLNPFVKVYILLFVM